MKKTITTGMKDFTQTRPHGRWPVPLAKRFLVGLFLSFFPVLAVAQITSAESAHERLCAELRAAGDDLPALFAAKQPLSGTAIIPTGKEDVNLGMGPGWAFYAVERDGARPIIRYFLVTTDGSVRERMGKALPRTEFERVADRLVQPLAPANILNGEDAFSWLKDRYLGPVIGDRNVYLTRQFASKAAALDLWRTQLDWGGQSGWLFFIDDHPGANWEHSCRYVLVKADGTFDVRRAMTPPRDTSGFKLLYSPVIQSAKRDEAGAPIVGKIGRPSDISPSLANGAASTPAANKYAVIISGGANQANNHIRYWNDSASFYSVLAANDFLDSHIYALISDGTSPAIDRSDGSNSPTDLDGDGDADTMYSATRANITTVFDELAGIMTTSDVLYIFTTDHGGAAAGSEPPYDEPLSVLNLWGEDITDAQFATEVDKVQAKAIACIFEQCFSGGMLDDLQAPNRVLMSAARYWELSYAKAGGQYDEFSYYATYALANPGVADANGDGEISMEEAYLYALAHDSFQEETISGGDNNGEHPSYFSDPWDLGRNLSLRGLSTPSAPVYFGYTQQQSDDAFPAGGTDQGWSGDDVWWTNRFAFQFPFAGSFYTQAYVSANGLLYFENPQTTMNNTIDGLKSRKAIAPHWDDLITSNIHVQSSSTSVVVRWTGCAYRDDRPVSFAIRLDNTGDIWMYYGAGNHLIGRKVGRDKTIGVSSGNGSQYHLGLRNGQWSLNNAPSILFHRAGVEPAETVSAPTTIAGPSSGRTNQPLVFTAGGATNSLGHAVAYRFGWGNGTLSPWVAGTATGIWSVAGTYGVTAQARCVSGHATSAWSTAKSVQITNTLAGSGVTRTLINNGSCTVTVSLAVSPGAAMNAYAAEDRVPTGLTASAISAGGGWDAVNRKVKWGPFPDHTNRTLTYKVKGANGNYSLSGVGSFDGSSVAAQGSGLVTINCSASQDSDGDGIPDAWELRWFSSLTNLTATSDWDGDHVLDVDEYRARTIPTNAQSYLQLYTFLTNRPGGRFVIRWQSVTGNLYRVERTTNLMQAGGGFTATHQHVTGKPVSTEVTDTTASASSPNLYRVGVE